MSYSSYIGKKPFPVNVNKVSRFLYTCVMKHISHMGITIATPLNITNIAKIKMAYIIKCLAHEVSLMNTELLNKDSLNKELLNKETLAIKDMIDCAISPLIISFDEYNFEPTIITEYYNTPILKYFIDIFIRRLSIYVGNLTFARNIANKKTFNVTGDIIDAFIYDRNIGDNVNTLNMFVSYMNNYSNIALSFKINKTTTESIELDDEKILLSNEPIGTIHKYYNDVENIQLENIDRLKKIAINNKVIYSDEIDSVSDEESISDDIVDDTASAT